MKARPALFVLALGLLSTVAPAQQIYIRRHHRIRAAKLHFHKARGKKVKDPLMNGVEKLISTADGLLAHSLPIYGGHKSRAEQLGKLALKQVKSGVSYEKMQANLASLGQPTNPTDPTLITAERQMATLKPSREKGNAAAYPAAQVQASNANVAEAYRLFRDAYNRLNSGGGNYGGHRVQALKLIDEVGRELGAVTH